MSEQQQMGKNNGCLEEGQLMAWLDGALSRQEAHEVMAHLATCARCTAEERSLRSDSYRVFEALSRLDPLPVASIEPAAALARFQTRLYAQNRATGLAQANGNIGAQTLPLSSIEGGASLPGRPSARRRRPAALGQALVAAVIIAALLGSMLLLLRSRAPSPEGQPKRTPSTGPIGTPTKVESQAGGLEMIMQITPGPYFLSEMLEADLTLTNHSQTTYWLEGTWDNPGIGIPDDHCHLPLKVVMTGGGGPDDTELAHNVSAAIACYGSDGTTRVLPGQTLSINQYLVLTSSGQVTLQVQGTFQTAVLGQDGVIHIVPSGGPLDGHWPSLRIPVLTQVPAQRLIALHGQPGRVVVDAPPAVRGRLLYLSAYDCVDRNSSQHGGGGYWHELQGTVIDKPQCGYSVMNGTPTYDTFVRWVYVVGVPGYSVVSGTYP